MSTFSIFVVLITIVCFLLIIVIMVQNPKGGGLSSAITGTQMLGGVQKTTDFLDKSTWTLGAILLGLILLSTLSFNNPDSAPVIPQTTGPAATETQAQPTAAPAPATATPPVTNPAANDTVK